MTRAEALAEVAGLLKMASFDADRVFAAIGMAQRRSYALYEDAAEREWADEHYAMLRLALADVTGQARFRL